MEHQISELVSRAERQMAEGRLRRAKEILQGSLRERHYALQPRVLRAYGTLQHQLGDNVEAGKYHFCPDTVGQTSCPP